MTLRLLCIPPYLTRMSVLFLYDGLLTLPEEIELIWRRKIRLGAALYLTARLSVFVLLWTNVMIDSLTAGSTSTRVNIANADHENVFILFVNYSKIPIPRL